MEARPLYADRLPLLLQLSAAWRHLQVGRFQASGCASRLSVFMILMGDTFLQTDLYGPLGGILLRPRPAPGELMDGLLRPRGDLLPPFTMVAR